MSPSFQNHRRNIKNIICKKIDPMELKLFSGVCEIYFAKEDGIVQFDIEITIRKLKTVFKKSYSRHKIQ